MQNTKLIKKISTSLVSTGEIIDSLQSNSSTNAPSIRAVNEALSDNFYETLNHVYPIGSIYISINDTNPATLFGGTWQQFGKGRTLVGVDENDNDFNIVQKTGGEKTHQLTINELPSHTHVQNAHTHSIDSHTHTIPAHSHGLNGHTHSFSATTRSSGAHTHTTTSAGTHKHYGLFYSDGRTIAMKRSSGNAKGIGWTWDGNAYVYESASVRTGETGAHTHTANSAGAHTHSVSGTTGGNSGSTANSSVLTSGSTTTSCNSSIATNQNTGNDESHNNLQPYITVYMWLRTA